MRGGDAVDAVRQIDSIDPAWATPSPSLHRPTLAVGTEITLHGYRRQLVHRELGWLHAALTGRLGRGHDPGGPGTSLRTQQWTIMPWPCQSGCGVVWWDETDGLAVARTRAPSRIGRLEVELECGPAIRIHTPPTWIAGSYPVRIETSTLVSVASVLRREGGEVRHAHARASAQCIESGLWSIARKLRIPLDVHPRVHVIADRTRPDSVYLRGKPGRIEGWSGQVDVLASAPARWLLECAARGLGLGARGAYGCGRVTVTPLG